jgi:hypothetical protein
VHERGIAELERQRQGGEPGAMIVVEAVNLGFRQGERRA